MSNDDIGRVAISGMSGDYLSPLLDQTLYNGVVRVSLEEVHQTTQDLARLEGLLLGPASGAAIAGAIEIAKRLGSGKKVVTISNGDY